MRYGALALTLGRGVRTGRSALAVGVIWLAPLTAYGADHDDIRQHLFHGAHDPGKLAGAVEVRIHSREVEVDATGTVVLQATVVNAKTGHMVPSGSAEAMAYQDLGEIREVEGFAGLKRDGDVPPGDRIFRLPHLDPQGRMTVAQWNTAAFGPDYRLAPLAARNETFTWSLLNRSRKAWYSR